MIEVGPKEEDARRIRLFCAGNATVLVKISSEKSRTLSSLRIMQIDSWKIGIYLWNAELPMEVGLKGK